MTNLFNKKQILIKSKDNNNNNNKNYIKSLGYKDKIINLLFKTYSNLTNNLFLDKNKRLNSKRFSSNKLFLSKAEMKHTNNNVIITLFIFNKNKNFIKYKLNKLQSDLFKMKNYK